MKLCQARKVWVGPGDTDRAWRIVLERRCTNPACPVLGCPKRRDNRSLGDVIEQTIDLERHEHRLFPELYAGKVATAVGEFQTSRWKREGGKRHDL